MRFESVRPFNSVFDLMLEIIDESLVFTTSVRAVEERESHLLNPESIARAAMFCSIFLVRKEFVFDQAL